MRIPDRRSVSTIGDDQRNVSSAAWLLLKDHRRAAYPFSNDVDADRDTVGNFDKGNSFVHTVVLTVEGHCAFNRARACSLTANRKRQLLLLSYSSNCEVTVEHNRIWTCLFNFC